jgi:hypothetical protein
MLKMKIDLLLLDIYAVESSKNSKETSLPDYLSIPSHSPSPFPSTTSNPQPPPPATSTPNLTNNTNTTRSHGRTRPHRPKPPLPNGKKHARCNRHQTDVIHRGPHEIHFHSPKHPLRQLNQLQNRLQIAIQQDETRLRDRHVAARRERDADVRGREGGRVVRVVADEGDDFARAGGFLEGLDVLGFLVGEDAGADVGDWDADLLRDAAGCGGVVAGAHLDGEVVVVLEGVKDGGGGRSEGVGDGEEASGWKGSSELAGRMARMATN